MKTIDIKRANFEEIFGQINELRFVVWVALKMYGPGTTREVARASNMDILTFRPRVTELCQLGFAYLVGRAGKDGVYAARNYEEARAWHEEQTRGYGRQMEFFSEAER